jgi:hypothetical protein
MVSDAREMPIARISLMSKRPTDTHGIARPQGREERGLLTQ